MWRLGIAELGLVLAATVGLRLRRFGQATATVVCIMMTSDPSAPADRPTIGVELSMAKTSRTPTDDS